jgi:hypothetical protein
MIRSLASPSIPDDLTPRARKVARDVVKLLKKEGIAHKISDPFWSPERYYDATHKSHQNNYEWFCMVLMDTTEIGCINWLYHHEIAISEICEKHGCYLEIRNQHSAYVGVHGL